MSTTETKTTLQEAIDAVDDARASLEEAELLLNQDPERYEDELSEVEEVRGQVEVVCAALESL